MMVFKMQQKWQFVILFQISAVIQKGTKRWWGSVTGYNKTQWITAPSEVAYNLWSKYSIIEEYIRLIFCSKYNSDNNILYMREKADFYKVSKALDLKKSKIYLRTGTSWFVGIRPANL